jgi:cytidylate kinase
MPHAKIYSKAKVDIFFEESRIKIRISKKILSRKRQTIRKDKTQSFRFKAIHCYDCQTADFLIMKGRQFFVFSEVLAEAFPIKINRIIRK